MYSVYRLLTVLTTPFLPLLLQWRLHRGKEDAARLQERLGHSNAQCPMPNLLWIHAASMGESASMLPLIDAFLAKHPEWQVMVTTVTVTSAKLMATKLPPRAFHQFAPLDNPAVLRRFFAHWQPQLAFWIESELWPNMAKMTPCPMHLINARMSERSFRRWQLCPSLLREMLQCFTAIFPQSEADAARFQTIIKRGAIAAGVAEGIGGVSPLTVINCLGNLKYDAPPLTCDETELATLQASLGNRPFWLASSTHAGEEEQIAQVHLALKKTYPDLLTILVPRHAPRGDAIAAMLHERSLQLVQRSKNKTIKTQHPTEQGEAARAVGESEARGRIPPQIEIYLADTMGELGLFYRLSEIVFIGGSLVPHGGQNLLEPARLNCAILCGQHMHNFAAVTAEMLRENAVIQVADAPALTAKVSTLLADKSLRESYAKAAAQAVQKHSGIVEALLQNIAGRVA